MRTGIPLIILLGAGMLLTSCLQTFSSPPQACTADFQIRQMQVLDVEGEPAESVSIQIAWQNSGDPFDPCDSEAYQCSPDGRNGYYTLIHDGFFEHDEMGREFKLHVTGTKGEMSFEADYTFRNDGCHIIKISGPDTVQLEINSQGDDDTN